MPSAARSLSGFGTLAAIHAAIAVGVATAIRMLAVVLPLPMLCMAGMRAAGTLGLVLSMAGLTMLRMRIVALMLLSRLRDGRHGEAERRRSGKKDGLHVLVS
jgi:hypothetical protein